MITKILVYVPENVKEKHSLLFEQIKDAKQNQLHLLKAYKLWLVLTVTFNRSKQTKKYIKTIQEINALS